MKRSYYSFLIFLILYLNRGYSFAQSMFNPDISIIPRFRLESNDGTQLPGKRIFNRPEFSLEEFELAFQSYLNPYARADIFLTKPGVGDEPVEIEEIYATFLRGLPFALNARIGKYRAEFGKLNSVHPHAWPFISQPLSLERFIGEEGLNDMGISISGVIPTGEKVYTKLTFDVLKGDAIGTIDRESGNMSGGIGLTGDGNENYYANSGRLMTFLPVGANSDLEFGISGLTGIHDPHYKYRFYYGNLDFKYKWKPNSYKSLILQGELLLNKRKFHLPNELSRYNSQTVSSQGGYLYGDYQFHKIFSIGARYDWAQSPYSKDDKAEGMALFLGYYPVEETAAFRLQYQITKFFPLAMDKYSINMIALQFMFSMGPHKAHPF